MAKKPDTFEICQRDLFTARDELERRYSAQVVAHVERVRDEYAWVIANPADKDRAFIERAMRVYGISQAAAYRDLRIVKKLLPMLSTASRDFHRWRSNEMILETYRMSKARKDVKGMERAASSYARINRVDLEDEVEIPYDEIVVQPFTATDDPSVLGIEKIPDLQKRIDAMLEQYGREFADISEIEGEMADTAFLDEIEEAEIIDEE